MESDSVAAAAYDSPAVTFAGWLTSRRAIVFLVAWLAAFAVFSVFVSNPFQSEQTAASPASYANVMYLHGLLVGMVGLAALLTMAVFGLRSTVVRGGILILAIVATVLASIGGVFDRQVPGAEVPMWTQVAGFFALDAILDLLLAGLWLERARAWTAGRLPWAAALAATFATAAAAVMGHVAGWTMEFGERFPTLLADYRQGVGFPDQGAFVSALVTSHSHAIAVGAMALAATLLVAHFGYAGLEGGARTVARIGVAMIVTGTVSMAAFYLATGLTAWSPPAGVAQIGRDPNVVPLDDVLTGVLVMGGGVLAALAFLSRIRRAPVRLAAVWSYLLAFATVAVAGYTIEFNTSTFGAGDPNAPRAANDAVFTWFHQDIGLFLLPTVVIVMLAAERLVAGRAQRDLIGVTALAGSTVLFVGGMIWVFIDPALLGPGYVASTVGIILVGLAILATAWFAGLRLPSANRAAPGGVRRGVAH